MDNQTIIRQFYDDIEEEMTICEEQEIPYIDKLIISGNVKNLDNYIINNYEICKNYGINNSLDLIMLAMHMEIFNGKENLVSTLIKSGILSTDSGGINEKDIDGNTPLHYLVMESNEAVENYLELFEDFIDFDDEEREEYLPELLEYRSVVDRLSTLSNNYCKLGANPNIPNNEGHTPMDLRTIDNEIMKDASLHYHIMNTVAGKSKLGKLPLYLVGDMIY